MFSSSIYSIETSSTSFPSLITKKNVRTAAIPVAKFSEQSTGSSVDLDSDSSLKSLNLKDFETSSIGSQQNDEISPKKSCIKLWKSQCFIEILKQFYMLHKDVEPYHIAKLQLLNKKCYDYFVPKVMQELKIKMEMAPCLLRSFEPDVRAIIEEKKSEGVKIGSAHTITLRFDQSFKNKTQAKVFMTEYLTQHPHLSETYTWTGEHWQVLHKKYCKSTVFKFISKTKQVRN
jgi:hypothetical protein